MKIKIKIAGVFLCLMFILSALIYAAPDKSEKSSEDFTINYKEYLKDPSKLGFSPDAKLFKAAYMMLKMKYVSQPDDAVLFNGVVREVNKLLKAASSKQTFNPSGFSDVAPAIDRLAASGLDKNLLWFSAIQGMLFSLEDPYTLLLPPKEFSALQEQTESASFGGVGVYIQQDKNNNNKVTVFEPIEDSPAYRAGLQPEDVIVSIDGKSIKDLPIEAVVAKMRGPEGSYITLEIERKGEGILTFKIKRENIIAKSVSCKLIDKTIGYIKVRTFGEHTADEFAKSLRLLEEKNIKGLIIDLRNNGGGLIDAAVSMASNLLPQGKVVVSVEPRSGGRQYLRSQGGGNPPNVPIVILINKYSASASEILSGAMQDYKLATLIGGQSYGKGSVQEVIPLSDGSAFKMTVARYFTPSGRNIDKKGITPDVKYDMDVKLVGRKGVDVQLEFAVNYLKKKI